MKKHCIIVVAVYICLPVCKKPQYPHLNFIGDLLLCSSSLREQIHLLIACVKAREKGCMFFPSSLLLRDGTREEASKSVLAINFYDASTSIHTGRAMMRNLSDHYEPQDSGRVIKNVYAALTGNIQKTLQGIQPDRRACQGKIGNRHILRNSIIICLLVVVVRRRDAPN